MKNAVARFFRRSRIWLFSARRISVGHCVTQSGNSVMLTVGRKSAGLTPAGARIIASQLNTWADHAEAMGSAVATMKYIINVRVAPKGLQIANAWFAWAAKESETGNDSLAP